MALYLPLGTMKIVVFFFFLLGLLELRELWEQWEQLGLEIIIKIKMVHTANINYLHVAELHLPWLVKSSYALWRCFNINKMYTYSQCLAGFQGPY